MLISYNSCCLFFYFGFVTIDVDVILVMQTVLWEMFFWFIVKKSLISFILKFGYFDSIVGHVLAQFYSVMILTLILMFLSQCLLPYCNFTLGFCQSWWLSYCDISQGIFEEIFSFVSPHFETVITLFVLFSYFNNIFM